MKHAILLIILISAASFACSCSAVPTLSFDPVELTLEQGSSGTISLHLSEAPEGLAGYDLVVTLSNPGTARITAVSYPSWAGLSNSSGVPGEQVFMSGVDINRQVEAGATGILLGTITIEGGQTGTSTLTVSDIHMDADGGSGIVPLVDNGKVVVGSGGTPVTWTTVETTVPATTIATPTETSATGSSSSGGSESGSAGGESVVTSSAETTSSGTGVSTTVSLTPLETLVGTPVETPSAEPSQASAVPETTAAGAPPVSMPKLPSVPSTLAGIPLLWLGIVIILIIISIVILVLAITKRI
jgi:hypothetical protein